MSSAFLIFFDLVFFSNFAFIFPLQNEQTECIIPMVLGIFTVFFWFRVQFSDPGFVEKSKNHDFLSLMQVVDPLKLCATCEVVKTARARHCRVCDKCVDRMDHHCPWINNCVGIKNHNVFMCFLVSLMTTLFWMCIQSIVTFLKYAPLEQATMSQTPLLFHVFDQSIHRNKYMLLAVALATTLMAGVFILFEAQILLKQIENYRVNRTTAERFGKKKAPAKKTKPAESMSSDQTTLTYEINTKDAEHIIAKFDRPPYFGRSRFENLKSLKDMCCSTAYPDHEEIYQDLIRGKQHLLHCHDDQNDIGRQNHTKSGGLKFDLVGRSFDGTAQDLESSTHKKEDTFDPMSFDQNRKEAKFKPDLNAISEENSMYSQEGSLRSSRDSYCDNSNNQ